MKKTKIIVSSLFVLITLLLSACSSDNIKGNGERTLVRHALYPHFNKISLSGDFKVIVNGNKTQKITVLTDSNLQPYIFTEVKGDALNISIKDDMKFVAEKKPTILIHSPSIVEIVTDSKTHLNATELQGKKLVISTSGNSTLELEGEIKDLTIESNHNSKINALRLYSNTAKAKISGTSNVNVNAKDFLDVIIIESGKLNYIGNPQIKKELSGDARIKQIKLKHNKL